MAAEIGVILLKLVVLLGVAKLAGELAERIRQPAVLGELLAGVILGPSLFGFVVLDGAPTDTVTRLVWFVAQLGLILLLFEVGVETKLSDLRRVGLSATLVAILGIVGSFGVGFGVSWLLGQAGVWSTSWLFHIFVGATFTATSVGITARVLSDLGRLATPEARIILGAAVLDDVAGLLILGIVTALAGGSLAPAALGIQFGIAIAFLVVSLLVGRLVMPWVMERVALMRVRGALLATAVCFGLLMAYLAELAHLAAIIGAFAAGTILAGTRKGHDVGERVRSVGDVFIPFFFVYVGLQVDLSQVGGDAGRLVLVVAVLTLAAILGKLLSGLGVVERGLDRLAVGVGMVPRGEVGLIFALIGLETLVDGVPLVEPWEYTALLLVVAISTFLTPLWLKRVLGRTPPKVAAVPGVGHAAPPHGSADVAQDGPKA